MTTTAQMMTTYYVATAVANGRPAGHVAYGRTKDEATRRSRHSQLPVRIARERVALDDAWDAQMVALGKLDPKW